MNFEIYWVYIANYWLLMLVLIQLVLHCVSSTVRQQLLYPVYCLAY